MKSNNITVTDTRLIKAIGAVNNVANAPRYAKIEKIIENNKIRIGKVTKFFHGNDMVEVQLDNVNKKVNCKILHSLCAEFHLLYTPIGDLDFDEKNGYYIKPRAVMNCLVLNINNNDSKDWLLIGYYSDEKTVSPPAPIQGTLKLTFNDNSIEFKGDGVVIHAPKVEFRDNFINEVISDETENLNLYYTKEEINERTYSQSEVDKLLLDLKAEIIEELQG